MGSRILPLVAAFLVLSSVPLRADERERAEWRRAEFIHHLHQRCEAGDRNACIRFGIVLGENRERHAEWRREHPEYFRWEH
jgi:hypothetical protein